MNREDVLAISDLDPAETLTALSEKIRMFMRDHRDVKVVPIYLTRVMAAKFANDMRDVVRRVMELEAMEEDRWVEGDAVGVNES